MRSRTKSLRAAWVAACLCCLCGLVSAQEAPSAYLPGDKVLAALAADGEDAIQVVKAGTSVILNGRIKNARTKYTIWRLKQTFGNIVDLTTMTPEAFRDLQKIEASFSEELALSFNERAQSALSQNLKFRVVEGRLVVSGKANNEEDIRRITEIAKIYDRDPIINVQVRDDMIEIDAIFCRVNRNNINDIGVSGLQSAVIDLPQYSVSYNGTGNVGSWRDAARPWGEGTYKNNGWTLEANTGVTGRLSAFFQVQESDIKLLVKPHLSTLNGQEAIFHSGGQQPFEIATDNVQTIEWKDYGTKLIIKPMLTTEGLIDTVVTIEFLIPLNDGLNRFTRFSHSGRAVLARGQAMVLSGLVQQLYSMGIDRTPGLSRIPILNFFFGRKEHNHDQDEMVVVVMPRLTQTLQEVEMVDLFRTSEESGLIIPGIDSSLGPVPELEKNRRSSTGELGK